MKFSFSTLGCPSWSWGEVLAAAHDLGYDGVEVRGLGRELYAPHISHFQDVNLPATKERLAKLGLNICCLTTACYLFDESNTEMMMQMGREYVDLADKLSVPCIRVLGDLEGRPSSSIDIDFVTQSLQELAQYASGKNVKVLLESNGVFGDTSLLASVLKKIDEPQAGALWDVNHPYHFFHEDVETSYNNLKPYLYHIHMKDSSIVDGQVHYQMMGYGSIPNDKILAALQRDDYQGYVSLEWLKRWNKNLTEPGIVFPQFINYVKDYCK